MYYDIIYSVRAEILATLTFLFFTILLLDKKSRTPAIAILVISFIFYMTPDLDESLNNIDYKQATLDSIYITICYNGAAILALMYNQDKLSKKHALLFACVIFLHVVVSLYIHNGAFWWNYYFVECYNEILIAIAILQLWVSKDGLIRLHHGIQRYNFRIRVFSGLHHSKSARIQTGRKKT